MNHLDVLYTPIDLPPCPAIDVKKLRAWVDESYPKQKDLIDITAGDVQSHNQLKNNYPWNFTFAKFFDWQQGFEQQFPELVDYINNIYKIQDNQLDIVAILPVRDKPSKIKFWHTDPDKFGLRFYVTNDRYKENPILIKKGLPGIPDEDMRGKIFEELDERLVNDQVYKANIVHPRQPFYLNNFKAAHAVEFNKEGDRIAVLLGVSNMMYDSAEFTAQMNTLITQSAQKYHKDAVFLHDWSDSIKQGSR